MSTWEFNAEIRAGDRYEFGKNWQRFLSALNEERIQEAERSLRGMLGVDTLVGKTFLDIGSGSGLFSLAAMRLGAERVHSFDYDPDSVACTRELRRRYFDASPHWVVEQGSALDGNYLGCLGQWDVVYSWGVLHHTGDMWAALRNAAPLVRPRGMLFVAIYNDQGAASKVWKAIKRAYNKNILVRGLIAGTLIPFYFIPGALMVDLARMRNPLRRYSEYKKRRGMSCVYDWFDWLGGYPFEVARPEEIVDFYRRQGFELEQLKTVGNRLGCNEFVFRKAGADLESALEAASRHGPSGSLGNGLLTTGDSPMCGFAGFIDFSPSRSGDELRTVVGDMAATLVHRGPDDAGEWVDAEAGAALGFRRLAILDLTPGGHQPMASASGRYVITFNGEVYNFAAIRRELESSGAAPAFRGHSDTEVILAAIEAWGVQAAVRRFLGMFALALWDRRDRRLYLIRDRLGVKPLYYGWAGKVFLFASELKALHAYPGFRPEVDRDVLTLFLRHLYVPAPYSIWKGVSKLLPGTILTISGPSSAVPTSYWSARQAVETGIADPFRGSQDEAIEQLEVLLRDAVGLRMIADVPLGVFLSGGIDSSTVVALMQVQSSRPVKTFTIGFQESDYDEARYAREVARHLGTEHHELYVTPAQAQAVIPRLPSLYDEPFADSSQIPTFLVSQLARQHVTVALSGDGGDEMFGGYNRYFWGRSIWNKVGWLPALSRNWAARLLTSVSPSTWDRLLQQFNPLLPPRVRVRTPGDKLAKLGEVIGAATADEMYHRLISCWKTPTAVVADGVEPPTLLNEAAQWPPTLDFTHRMMYLDLMTYLPDDILVKVDRASMGVSLEAREPLLDHRIVEFAWKLPLAMKVRGAKGKWLLRQVLYRHVPPELIDRPKTGFGLPVGSWLRGPLRDWAESLLAEARLRREGFFHAAPIRTKWKEHLSGRRSWHYYLWGVLMFQAWLEQWGAAPSPVASGLAPLHA